MQARGVGKFLKLNTGTHIRCTHATQSSTHTGRSFLKYFEEVFANHGCRVTGERQTAGGFRVAVVALVALVHQAVDVAGQAGGRAHGVVPQDVDDIVQPIQSILHLRLQTAGIEIRT